MAADLASTPASGLRVQLCGDAHLSNFGAFASPERRLVFGVNDFDETLPGPFEWDVHPSTSTVKGVTTALGGVVTAASSLLASLTPQCGSATTSPSP
jgi:uncharacterized protein (DUF2252 family)